MANSMEDVILKDEQEEQAPLLQDEVPLSTGGRSTFILKNGETEEDQKEVDKAGSSGSMKNPNNAGYDQRNPVGMFPVRSGQHRDQGRSTPPPDWVVTNQPYATTTVGMGATPPDYLFVSVLACVCCCWPVGLCAIYYASKRNNLVAEGKTYEATRMANNARNLTILSVVLGVIWIITVIIVFKVVTSNSNHR